MKLFADEFVHVGDQPFAFVFGTGVKFVDSDAEVVERYAGQVFWDQFPKLGCVDVDVSARVLLHKLGIGNVTFYKKHLELIKIPTELSRLNWVESRSG